MASRDRATSQRGVYRRRLAAAAAASLALHLLLARGLALTSLGLDGRTSGPTAAPQNRPKPRVDFTIRTSRSPAALPAHERPLTIAAAPATADRATAPRPAARAAAERRPEDATEPAPSPAPVTAPARIRDLALESAAAPTRAAAAPPSAAAATTVDAVAPAPDLAAAAPAPATLDRSRDAAAVVASRWRPREVALLERLAAPAPQPPQVTRDDAGEGVPKANAADRAATDGGAGPGRRAVAASGPSATVAPLGDAAAAVATDAPAPAPAPVTGSARRGGAAVVGAAVSGGAASTDASDGPPSRIVPDARGIATIGGSGRRGTGAAAGSDLGAPRQPGRVPLAAGSGGGAGAATADPMPTGGGGPVAAGAPTNAPGPRAVGRTADAGAGGAPLAATSRRGSVDDLADEADGAAELSMPAPASGTVARPRRADDEPAADALRPLERVAVVALPAEGRVRDVAEAFARRGRDTRPDRRADPRARRAEAVVDRGLAFLAQAQQGDGRWSLGHFAGSGPADVPELASDTAATGLALLAFLGAGHDHFDGPYRDAVRRGLEFLLSVQKPDGDLYVPADERSNGCGWLYSHGMASIALCEAVGMTGDPLVRPAAARACGFIAASQHPERGGWRYTPRSDADLSVSGWMLVALRSGALAGVETDPRALAGVRVLLDAATAADNPAGYAYNPQQPDQRAGEEPSRACMTAVGALMRLHTGAKPDDPRVMAAARALAARRPAYDARSRDAYLWYYASQVLVHTGGPEWDAWYAALVDTLASAQETAGAKAGSWNPLGPLPDRWGRWGGRIYVTALHLLALEVPDRRLPTYTAGE